MFFTLISKILFKKITSPRTYLYIFSIGAVCYSILHWYLYSKTQEGLMGKLKQYLYYLMVVDVIVAVALYKLFPSKESKEEEDNEDNREKKEELTKEQQLEMIQRMMVARKQQQIENNKENCEVVKEVVVAKEEVKEEETKEPELPVYKD